MSSRQSSFSDLKAPCDADCRQHADEGACGHGLVLVRYFGVGSAASAGMLHKLSGWRVCELMLQGLGECGAQRMLCVRVRVRVWQVAAALCLLRCGLGDTSTSGPAGWGNDRGGGE